MTQENGDMIETVGAQRPLSPPPHPHPHPHPPVPRPNPLPPGRFSLTFDGFFAFDTRALEADTLWLLTSVATPDNVLHPPIFASQQKFLGDFHGNDLFNDINFTPLSQPVEVDAGSPLYFGHLLLNYGHPSDIGGYSLLGSALAEITLSVAYYSNRGVPDLASVAAEIAEVSHSNFDGCDGVVAFQVFALSWEELVRGTQTTNPLYLSSDEPGYPSPELCGAISHYRAYWSIRRA